MSQIQLSPQLKAQLSTLPTSPGVYFHKNFAGEIIYVGKAAILKNRVRQYFNNSPKDPKTTALVQEIASFDYIVVDSEIDALFLESEMIKRYLPKWNILLRDDKTVSYLRINLKDQIPYLSFTRLPLDDKAHYIGPFYSKTAVDKALRSLRRVFPYYDRPYTGQKTLYTDLGLTPGIEINKTTPEEYKKSLKKLILYLEGGKSKLLKSLEQKMQQAATDHNYEQAAKLRDEIFGIKALNSKIVFSNQEFLDLSSDQALVELQKLFQLPAPPRRIEGYDISHQSGTNAVASMVVFQNGASDRSSYRKFKIHHSKNNDFDNLRQVLTRRLQHRSWPLPDIFLIDGGKPQLEAVKSLLLPTNIPFLGLAEAHETIVIPHILPDGGIEYQYLQLSPNTHLLKLLQRIRDEAHRFAVSYHTYLKRQNMLK